MALLFARDKNKLLFDAVQKSQHEVVSQLLDKGADLRAVQELLGHRSLATTEHYTHVSAERLKQAYRQAHPHADKKDI